VVCAADADGSSAVSSEGYTLNFSKALDKEHEGKPLKEIITLPPSALQGLADHSNEMWAAFRVKSIKDLGGWKFYQVAKAITALAAVEEAGGRPAKALSNINAAVDAAWEKKTFKELASAPVSALQGLAEWSDTALKALNVKSISDLAKLKYCVWAESLTTLSKFENEDFSSSKPKRKRAPGAAAAAAAAGKEKKASKDGAAAKAPKAATKAPKAAASAPKAAAKKAAAAPKA